jgi:hypothetical protein
MWNAPTANGSAIVRDAAIDDRTGEPTRLHESAARRTGSDAGPERFEDDRDEACVVREDGALDVLGHALA